MKSTIKLGNIRRIFNIHRIFGIAVLAAITLFGFVSCENPTSGPKNQTPVVGDYTITGLQQVADGTPKEVTITPIEDKSKGEITIHYEGIAPTVYEKNTTAPSAVGSYKVTFDVAAASGWEAASGFEAGTLIISVLPIPVPSDYDITGLDQTPDGEPKAVTIKAKDGKSTGERTIYYEGIAPTVHEKSTTAPSAAGTYKVTFDVAAVEGSWESAEGLEAGTLVLKYTPVKEDFTVTGLEEEYLIKPEGSIKIEAIPDKSNGAITIYYEGIDGTLYVKSTEVPGAGGKYKISFDVAETDTWKPAGFEEAGEFTIAPQYKEISAGESHTVALKDDGTLWAWGLNQYGQLGNDKSGHGEKETTPVQIGTDKWEAVAAGDNHTVAIKDDGTLWAWGLNQDGQLGYDNGGNTNDNRSTPVQVPGLTGVKAVAAGESHTIALDNNGNVWAWGSNEYGQVGNGNTTASSTPVQVLTGVEVVAAGGDHTVALKEDDTVWAWGALVYKTQGNSNSLNIRKTPVQVEGLAGVEAVAAGGDHTVALKDDGTLWAWGGNIKGQLGDGSTTYDLDTKPFVQITGTDWKAVSAGIQYTVALKEDGSVWAWGNNYYGQLGNNINLGSNTGNPPPVQVQGLTGVKAVFAGDSHTVALKEDGSVWAWGLNIFGQLGNNTNVNTMNANPTPVQIYPSPVTP